MQAYPFHPSGALPPRPDRRAFSLIELLTVLAIIAILTTIVIVGVGRVRESSNSVVCKSNLRQIGVATSLYVTDNKVYPSGVSQLYVSELAPYLNPEATDWQVFSKGTKIDECPSRQIVISKPYDISYSTNPFIFVNGSNTERLGTDRILRPSEIILIGDAIQQSTGSTNSRLLAYQTTALRTATEATADNALATGPDEDGRNADSDAAFRYRHNGRANVLMADLSIADFAKGTIKQRHMVINY